MKNETPTERTCPKCGCVYTRVPALSRTDNKTLICPDCAGVSRNLLAQVHRATVGIRII